GGLDEERMAARNEQRQMGKGRWLGLEQRGEEVSLQVVHPDRRHTPRVCQAARERRAREKCPDQAGSGRVGYAVQLARVGVRPLQPAADLWQPPPHGVGGGELRAHAAVRAVQLYLTVELMREQPRVCIEHRGSTLVTG